MEKIGFYPYKKLCLFKAAQETKGVFLLSHGLNLDPVKMLDMSSFLQSIGYDVILLSYFGHRENSDINEVRPQIWIDEVKDAMEKAQQYSEENNLPLYLMSYSLSGLLFQLVLKQKKFNITKQILIAPALGIRSYVQAGRFFAKVGSPEYIMPRTSFYGYRYSFSLGKNPLSSFFQLYDQYKLEELDKLSIPTLLFYRKKDELISAKKLQKASSFEKVQMHEIKHNPDFIFQHMLVDSLTMGPEQWKLFRTQISQWI